MTVIYSYLCGPVLGECRASAIIHHQMLFVQQQHLFYLILCGPVLAECRVSLSRLKPDHCYITTLLFAKSRACEVWGIIPKKM